jgi:hypothetical protein
MERTRGPAKKLPAPYPLPCEACVRRAPSPRRARPLDCPPVPDSAWEAIFMLLILKIPVIYLFSVVWWAVRSEPEPGGGDEIGALAPLTPCGWDDWRRRRALRPRPLGPNIRPLRAARSRRR